MGDKVNSPRLEDNITTTPTTVPADTVSQATGQSGQSKQSVDKMKSPALKLKDMLILMTESNKDTTQISVSDPDTDDVTGGQTDNSETLVLKGPDYNFTGHFTRSAKKSLQCALSSRSVVSIATVSDTGHTVTNTAVTTQCVTPSQLSSPLPTPLAVSVSRNSTTPPFITTSTTSVSTSATGNSSNNSNNSSNSTTTTISSNYHKSHSIIAHILSGEDKNLNGVSSQPADNGCGQVLDVEDNKDGCGAQASLDEDCDDVNSFLDDAICDTSLEDKLGSYVGSEWDMDTNYGAGTPPDKEGKETLTDSGTSSLSATSNDSCATSTTSSSTSSGDIKCLLVSSDHKCDQLKHTLMQALQTSSIKVVPLKDAAAVCNSESFQLIWIKVPTPVREDLLRVSTSVRYSSKKNKSAYIIAIADKQPDVDLHLRGFDEVYVEPVPVEMIRQKYLKLKQTSMSPSSGCTSGSDNTVVPREATNTPESTISLDSFKTPECRKELCSWNSSQSSTCDSASSGMDTQDITFRVSQSKCSLTVPAPNTSAFLSTSVHDKSPIRETPSPPSWCRVEHATKEKQRSQGLALDLDLTLQTSAHSERRRRERIKDSCDQLRVLLPYVRGRKTDMASILEMTVDYLKIVNAALPQDFQSQVIDIMSNGGPNIEGRIWGVETMNMATKKMNALRNMASETSPLGKPLHIVEKKPSSQTSSHCNNDQAASSRMVTRSLSRNITSNSAEVKTGSGGHSTSATRNSAVNSSGGSSAVNGTVVPKRECPVSNRSATTKAKRPHMAILSPMEDSQSASVVYLPTGTVTPIKEPKKENILEDITSQGHHYSGLQFPHMFTEGDISANRMFSSGHMTGSDLFPYPHHSQMNSSTPRVGATDRSDVSSYGGMYFDGAFYHYYPSLQDSTNGNYFVSGGSNEYVNPNAVLPMTSYTPMVTFTSGRKYDRTSSSELSERYSGVGDNCDLFNNNCNTTSLKPSTPD